MPLIRKPDKNAPQSAPATADTLKALTDRDAGTRWSAARAAAQLPGGVAALAAALPDESDPRVREAMFTSLARVATPESAAAVVPLLRRDDASLRIAALDALRAMPQAALAELPALLADDDSDVRILSCEIARMLSGTEATPLLSALLAREADVNVCAAAIDVLAEVGGAAALATLDALAARFPDEGFLEFSIGVARERILAQLPESHG